MALPNHPVANANADAPDLMFRAQKSLGMTHLQFGRVLGVSARTSARWRSGQSLIPADVVGNVIEMLMRVDVPLAAELAETIGHTLVSLGLEKAPAPPPLPLVAPPKLPAASPLVVDSIVVAFADAANATPRRARAGLLAALARARELGVTMDQLERALSGGAGAAER